MRQTPIGRCKLAALNATNQTWHKLMQAETIFSAAGTLRIRFIIDRFGRTAQPRIVVNTGSPVMESVVLEAVRTEMIELKPDEAAALLKFGPIPMEMQFDFKASAPPQLQRKPLPPLRGIHLDD